MDPAATLAQQPPSLLGYGVLAFLSLLSTFAMLWKTSRDQTHQLKLIELNHKLDAADRAERAANEKAERAEASMNLRQQLANETNALQSHVVEQSATVKDDTRLVLALQTADLKSAIDAAKGFMAERADAAYDAANDVNQKLRALNEAHREQGKVLERLLGELSRSSAFPRPATRVDDPPGSIVGRRVSDAPGTVVQKVNVS